LQEMAVVQAVPGAADGGDPEGADAGRLAALLPADETQLFYSIVLAGRAELALAPDEYSGLVMVLLRMLAFAPPDRAAASTTPGPASTPTTRASKAAAHGEPAVAVPTAVAPVAAAATAVLTTALAPIAAPRTALPTAGERDRPQIDGTRAADLWCSLVQRLVAAGAIAAMVRELAMQAECIGIVDTGAEQIWQLRVERENLRAPALRERLQTAASQAVGRGLRLEVDAAAAVDTPATRDAAERDRRQAEAERAIEQDPLVRALMAQYKTARIVPGSVKPQAGPAS
ncbi:MAG TPA: DNA polymerase III subunit gamma/tau, partial [Caldimonas sp.]|nr:DNA polymerase III subunit gamma/tau [Caldimonas sp.]